LRAKISESIIKMSIFPVGNLNLGSIDGEAR
jgi:hypothetical protein